MQAAGNPERRIVVLGELEKGLVSGESNDASGWRLLEVPSVDAADELLSTGHDIRVGLWACAGELSSEARDRFSGLRARHARVQWLALLDAPLADERLAGLIANEFFDYLTLPLERERLDAWAGHAYGMSLVIERARGAPPADEEQIVGASEAMRLHFRDIRKVAATDAPVLISGESGAGKELTARSVHERSARRGGPFIAVDCAAIPATLIQCELFGYEKGAFTGAAQRRFGRIESAQGGTLFLDEVGDLQLDMQGNLLRFLQESTVQRLGSTKALAVDVRVVAATHVDLEAAVRQGRFREDLYYRLNVLRLHVPALREREGDVEVLARYFLGQFLKDTRKAVLGYTRQAIEAMHRHAWPGNIRELINRVRRAVVMCEGRWITARDLQLDAPPVQDTRIVALGKAREAAEQQALAQALKMSSNNYSAAARMLGVSRVTLYRLLEKHRLPQL